MRRRRCRLRRVRNRRGHCLVRQPFVKFLDAGEVYKRPCSASLGEQHPMAIKVETLRFDSERYSHTPFGDRAAGSTFRTSIVDMIKAPVHARERGREAHSCRPRLRRPATLIPRYRKWGYDIGRRLAGRFATYRLGRYPGALALIHRALPRALGGRAATTAWSLAQIAA